ncbi:unnamed protein product [Lymnaea stagnalis]|uniref:Uncharacterized protein n=1 Tax=Lymnaea stagnalis TaxID=6523 RepID=A0AAV2HZ00_LYMST
MIDSPTPFIDLSTSLIDSSTPFIDLPTSLIDSPTPLIDSSTSLIDSSTPRLKKSGMKALLLAFIIVWTLLLVSVEAVEGLPQGRMRRKPSRNDQYDECRFFGHCKSKADCTHPFQGHVYRSCVDGCCMYAVP